MENQMELKESGEIAVQIRPERKILHFSDGTMEMDNSDDDDDQVDSNNVQEVHVDESKMTWGPWMIHKAQKTGNTVLAGCDYVGETLAEFLGITTPKYSYEIEEFKKMQEEKAKMDLEESSGWAEIKKLSMEENVENSVISKEKY